MRFMFQSYSIDITMKIYHGWPALMGLAPYWARFYFKRLQRDYWIHRPGDGVH